MEKVEVKLMNAPAGSVLTILEGQALAPLRDDKVSLSGDIETVSNFLTKRYVGGLTGTGTQFVNKETAVVVVDEENGTIVLDLDPQNPLGAVVTGTLEYNPELKPFYINENKIFKREDFIKLIKFNKRLFDNPEKHNDLLLAIQKLTISTAGEVNQSNDTRGNRGNNFQKTVNSDSIPTQFVIKAPIYKGQQEERFMVEICLDATDANVSFWFESIELADLLKDRKKEIFAKQIAGCGDFPIINK